MAIDFNQSFKKPTNSAASTEDRPKAEFWINLGYDSGYKPEGSEESLFISLPQGIPLDTQEHLSTNSSNAQFAAMRAAQNDLLDQLIAKAETLQPGEATTINITVQLRRVKAPAEPILPENNPLAKKLTF